jgi:succinyl-CoA synthetase beta subunit
MNTHEYQAKEILQQYGVPMPPFRVAENLEEAKQALEDMKLESGVVKIQVHAGGRGKAGGVKLGKSRDELLEHCQNLIGMKMVNNQTGPDGVVAQRVMIAPDVDIAKEYYVGAVIDRQRAEAALILSPDGGVDIEEVAAKTPERILTVPIRFDGALKPFQKRTIAQFMGWQGETAKKGVAVVSALAKAFIETDASLLEINPLVETADGDIQALDAKLSVDENALYRQAQIAGYYDATQVNPNEAEANKHDLAYIALDGSIGCMVNGAGLAMATMDIIQHCGSSPANFLDVGGSADEEKVAEGFKVILSDPKVKAILVNIFGGIMNCATIARGVIAAAKSIGIDVPLVVRLEGTNVEEGRRLLAESSLNLISAASLGEAAEKVVASIQS